MSTTDKPLAHNKLDPIICAIPAWAYRLWVWVHVFFVGRNTRYMHLDGMVVMSAAISHFMHLSGVLRTPLYRLDIKLYLSPVLPPRASQPERETINRSLSDIKMRKKGIFWQEEEAWQREQVSLSSEKSIHTFADADARSCTLSRTCTITHKRIHKIRTQIRGRERPRRMPVASKINATTSTTIMATVL